MASPNSLGGRSITPQEIVNNLHNMPVTGIFKRGRKAPWISETRNGRFLGWGHRTILRADFFDAGARSDPVDRFGTLIHESWHASYEDWSEDSAEQYADRVVECLEEELKKKGKKYVAP